MRSAYFEFIKNIDASCLKDLQCLPPSLTQPCLQGIQVRQNILLYKQVGFEEMNTFETLQHKQEGLHSDGARKLSVKTGVVRKSISLSSYGDSLTNCNQHDVSHRLPCNGGSSFNLSEPHLHLLEPCKAFKSMEIEGMVIIR